MPTIEIDLKEVLSEFKQEFANLNRRLDRMEGNLTDLKVSQAQLNGKNETIEVEIKGEMAKLQTEIAFLREDVRDLKTSQRTQIWALIATVIGATTAAVIKFGFFPRP